MSLKTDFSDFSSQMPPLTEYPRPLLKRTSYYNLNGYWDYAITKTNKIPNSYDGNILVPFSPESELSGVNRQLMPDEFLWYHRIIQDPRTNNSNRVLLQFGAVDQTADIFINNYHLFSHQGGYLPFSIDITDQLTEEENSLLVMVTDVSDSSYHARGKQKLECSGMFYTAQSGIWQTVFMECVPSTYIQNLKITPDIDTNSITFELTIAGNDMPSNMMHRNTLRISKGSANPIKSSVCQVDDRVTEQEVLFTKEFSHPSCVTINLPKVHYWTPEDPYLYDVTITYGNDVVESYFAMRKISIGMDQNQILRLFLNNEPYFQNGLLDQGYWPESLYTPPSDEAMIYDITMAKDLGFNLLRKHAKLEPSRWYYHCDRLGVLVWQDFVNGGSSYRSWFVTIFPTVFPRLATLIKDNTYRLFSRSDELGKEEFLSDMKRTVEYLYNHPSIVVWVPFNEGWGQFDSIKVTEYLKGLDNTRLIDTASGWFDQGCGDVRSLHIYFTPMRFRPSNRALVLSEFGGYTLRIPSHTYSDSTYGYRHYKTSQALTDAIVSVYEKKIIPGIEKGLCAVVYTQLSDIEEEINGLITYDRKVLKVEKERIIKMNQLCKKMASNIKKDD
jgi:hypothetical protein|nr:sugar-binding domain-containing protein [uncultured Lachnoclostridium sp.]